MLQTLSQSALLLTCLLDLADFQDGVVCSQSNYLYTIKQITYTLLICAYIYEWLVTHRQNCLCWSIGTSSLNLLSIQRGCWLSVLLTNTFFRYEFFKSQKKIALCQIWTEKLRGSESIWNKATYVTSTLTQHLTCFLKFYFTAHFVRATACKQCLNLYAKKVCISNNYLRVRNVNMILFKCEIWNLGFYL